MAQATLRALICAGILCSAAAKSAEVPAFDQVLANAAKEGKVTAWIQSPSRPETARALEAAFNKRFNLHVQIEWVVAPAPASNTRAIAEMAGGHVSVDVIGVAADEEVAVAAKAGLIKPYPWSAVFAPALPQVAAVEALMMPDFKGDALPYIQAAYGIGWNPQLIGDEDVPERLTDLAAPKWAGRFAVNAFFLGPVDIAGYALGEAPALDLARRLIANDPVYARGTAAVARAITTGEVPVGITVSPVAEQLMRQQQPMKFKLFSDVIPVSQLHLYVPEGAPDPNAGRLFTAWLVTEGIAIGNRFEPLSSPADAQSPVAQMIAAQVRKTGAKIAAPASPEALESDQRLRAQIAALENGRAAK